MSNENEESAAPMPLWIRVLGWILFLAFIGFLVLGFLNLIGVIPDPPDRSTLSTIHGDAIEMQFRKAPPQTSSRPPLPATDVSVRK